MADQRIHFKRFDGGLSDDDTYGPKNSASIGKNINTRTSPRILTLHRLLTKESGSTVTKEIVDAIQVANGDIYLAGKNPVVGTTTLYKRVLGSNGGAGTYSVVSAVNTGSFMNMDYDTTLDAIFTYDQNGYIGYYAPISNSPTYDNDYFGPTTVNASSNSGGTYTLPTSLTETDKFSFTATDDPMISFSVNINAKGTGDWTFVVHDAANNVVTTGSVLNALLPASGVYEFSFLADMRTKIGSVYHVHLYVSSGISSIVTSSANTLATADFSAKAKRLANSGIHGHPLIRIGSKTYFCNERYIGEWEILDTSLNATSGYNPYRITLPADYITINVAQYSEYLATACLIKNSDDTTTMRGAGAIVFWNTTDTFINFVLPIPDGAPNSLYADGGVLYFEVKGRLCRWPSRTEDPYETLYEFPGVDKFVKGTAADTPATDPYLRAGRQVIATRDSTLAIGFPYQTANAAVEIGMYSHGSRKSYDVTSINQDQLISTGTQSTQFSTSTSPDTPVTGITLVRQFGTNTLVAWKDVVGGVVTYGVDYVNESKGAATTGRWATLWFDNGEPDKTKTAKTIKAVAKTLPAGCTITPIIGYDRSETFDSAEAGAVASAGATESIMPLHREFYEARVGVDMASSSGNFPEVTAISFKFDDCIGNNNDTEAPHDSQV